MTHLSNQASLVWSWAAVPAWWGCAYSELALPTWPIDGVIQTLENCRCNLELNNIDVVCPASPAELGCAISSIDRVSEVGSNSGRTDRPRGPSSTGADGSSSSNGDHISSGVNGGTSHSSRDGSACPGPRVTANTVNESPISNKNSGSAYDTGGTGTGCSSSCPVHICQLLWEEPGTLGSLHPDIILGADLCYNPDYIPALLRLMQRLLLSPKPALPCAEPLLLPKHQACAYLATTIRNEGTLQYMYEQANALGLHLEDIRGLVHSSPVGLFHAYELVTTGKDRIIMHRITLPASP